MTYILEYAKSDRSSCSGPKKECPSSDRTIGKGELRLGVEVPQLHGITWRHWTCTTHTVIQNMHKALSQTEKIEGFEELLSEDQERVMRAWNEGNIPENEKPELCLQRAEDKNEVKPEQDGDNMKNEEVYELEKDENGVEEESNKEEHEIDKDKGKKKEKGPLQKKLPKEEVSKEEPPKEEYTSEEEGTSKEKKEHSNESVNDEEELKAKTSKRSPDEIKQDEETKLDNSKKRDKKAIAVSPPPKGVIPKVSRFRGRGRRTSARALRSPSTRQAMNAKASSSTAQGQGMRGSNTSSQDAAKASTRVSSSRKRTGAGYTTGIIKKRVKQE